MTDQAVDPKGKNFLTKEELDKLFKAARECRNPVRNYCLLMMMYHHGLRVSEATGMFLDDVDLAAETVFVRRLKGSLSTHQPIVGSELRAIRAWLRERTLLKPGSRYLFTGPHGQLTRFSVNRILNVIGKKAGLGVHYPHALRHSCGYYLANSGQSTRLIQDYLGHKSPTNTAKYTRTAPKRFERLFD